MTRVTKPSYVSDEDEDGFNLIAMHDNDAQSGQQQPLFTYAVSPLEEDPPIVQPGEAGPSSSTASIGPAKPHKNSHDGHQDTSKAHPPQEHLSQSDLDRSPSMLNRASSVIKQMWSGDDVVIAVMGMTGSGKTTFISKVTGRKDLKIGHNLTSCTRDIQVVETKIEGRTVRFVDTPGFSDTHLSDTEVLQLIADYLSAAYKQKMKLSGLIYLHPISDRRVTHHSTKNLEMFRYLTGEKNLKNVVLATSMWDKVTQTEGEEREAELKSKFWRMMLVMGAKTARHHGTHDSAVEVARLLLKNDPFYLQLQEEMGELHMLLKDTKAGEKVWEDILQMKADHKRELAEMNNMMKSFKEESKEENKEESKRVIEALREEYQRQIEALQKTLADERLMKDQNIRQMQDRINALENKGGCAVM